MQTIAEVVKEAIAVGTQGMGRMGGTAEGPGGKCVCPVCGATVAHATGTPCYSIKCPKCGAKMGRPVTKKSALIKKAQIFVKTADFKQLLLQLLAKGKLLGHRARSLVPTDLGIAAVGGTIGAIGGAALGGEDNRLLGAGLGAAGGGALGVMAPDAIKGLKSRVAKDMFYRQRAMLRK